MIRRFARGKHEDPEREETGREELRREPLPLSRAILWSPLPDSYHLLASMMRARAQQAQLFVSQRAFLQVERHLQSAPDLEVGGFLAGHLCECPRSRTRYSVINTVVPFAEVTGDPLGARVTQRGFETVRRRLHAHSLSLIGWYRNGNGLGLQLLPDDIETHLTYFHEPWQTTMLVAPDHSKPKGAFLTYDPRAGRGYCIPFYELLEAHTAESKRLDRTCVSWMTYVASAPVQPLAPGERDVVETTLIPLRSEPEPAPPEPIDEWVEAIKDPWVRLKDAAVRPTRRDDPVPMAYEPEIRKADPIPISLEPTKRPPARVEKRAPDEPVVNEGSALTAEPREAPKKEPTRPAPPFAGPPRSSARPPLAPEAARPAPRRAPPAPRPIPLVTAEAMRKASIAPEGVLPPDFEDIAFRWQRRRRIGFTVAAASFLAAIVLLSVRSRSETIAQAATSAAVSERPSAATAIADENGHAPISLSLAVDSLSTALAYYRAIANEHRAGRVHCRVLERAYALVYRARERVDAARRQVAGHLTDADSIRVSMLGAEYTFVAQTYRRSGCDAPPGT